MTLQRLRTIPLGTRVVVRYLIEDGERATDALGDLVERTEDRVTIQTRRGPASVPLSQVLLAKPVPPPPEPRRRRTRADDDPAGPLPPAAENHP